MGRSPCCSKVGLNKGAWTATEDEILISYIKEHGEGQWRKLSKRAGLKRCGKSCRLRWLNYLRPDIKRGNISQTEEDLIIRLHKLLGNKWSLIAGRLPGRTDNEIKNYWNTTLSKKVNLVKESNSMQKNPVKGSLVETRVIRTKASRCTKVALPPQEQLFSFLNRNQVVDVGSSKVHRSPNLTLPESDPFDTATMEYDIGSMCITSGSNVLQVPGAENLITSETGDGGNVDDDRSMLLHEKMFKDWTEDDCCKPDFALNLQSLASFLDLEENWV